MSVHQAYVTNITVYNLSSTTFSLFTKDGNALQNKTKKCLRCFKLQLNCKLSRRQVECWRSFFRPLWTLLCLLLPFSVVFLLLCVSESRHREPVKNSAEVTHLCVSKCKTLDGESVNIVGYFDMAAILADFKIFRWFFFLACRHIPYLSIYVLFTAVVEVGAEHCEET
jgi:hypothetical protein